MMAERPLFSSVSTVARARTVRMPRPSRYASRIGPCPQMKPAVGKSGPGMYCMSSSTVSSGCSISATSASHTSPRLWGGTLVAMPVVALEHLAHHARALGVPAIVDESLAEHGVEDAAVDRLQTVARVRQGPPDDDRHRVVHVGLAHLVLDVDREPLPLHVHGQMSRKRTLRAFASMNFRRGSTSSPIRVEKTSSAS